MQVLNDEAQMVSLENPFLLFTRAGQMLMNIVENTEDNYNLLHTGVLVLYNIFSCSFQNPEGLLLSIYYFLPVVFRPTE